MDLLVLGLVISVLGNVVQVLMNLCRMYSECYKHRQEVIEQRKRESYEDLSNESASFA